jgi:two-component system sensor histidine kinase BaeS
MKIGIKYRLFAALLAATALVALGMFLIMQWSIDRGFLRYVNTVEQERLERLAEEVEQAFAEGGSWDFLRADPGHLFRLALRTLPEGRVTPERLERMERWLERQKRPGFLPEGERLPPHLAHRFEARILLLDDNRRPVAGNPGIAAEADLKPLRHERQVVGYLGLAPRKGLSDALQLSFVKQQKLALALVAGVSLVVSALLALPLASRLVRPIRSLAAATRRLTAGEYAARVPVTATDELGRLAQDFNTLALTLEKNEQARRQWVADISHELRTPLAVLRGEIEAIQDGVRQATPSAVASLHAEVLRIGRLVDDLYQLALSDIGALNYRKDRVSFTGVLEDALEAFRSEFERKRIDLHYTRPPGDFILMGDRERLHQLLANLLENSLRYTDPGGRLEVALEQEKGKTILTLRDSAPGVPAADLERLFDRLYRVEGSRSRASGGAGLGLSICRNIVEAHGGEISAAPSPSGGLEVTVVLPLER